METKMFRMSGSFVTIITCLRQWLLAPRMSILKAIQKEDENDWSMKLVISSEFEFMNPRLSETKV